MDRGIKIVISFFIFLFSWGCMLEESPPESQSLISSLFSYEGENKTVIGLLTVLKQQTFLQENTLELLGNQEEMLFDYAELRSGPIYRTYYLIPIRDKTTNRINKAFVYKIIEEATKQTNAFCPIISEIVVLDAQELNRIPAHQRFLDSSPFKKWEEQGLNVSSDLTDFAKKLDGKWHRLEPHELPVSITRVSMGSFVTMTYELHLNNDVAENGDINVYGIPSYVADSIFLSNQQVLESCLGEQISFYFDYRSFTIRLEDGDLTTNPNLDIAIGNFMAANDLSFGSTFPFYQAITWEITATSADPPSGGDNTGGNTGGGSTGGGSSPSNPGGEVPGQLKPMLVDSIYHPNSSLTPSQKRSLNQATKRLNEKYPEFSQMYERFQELGIQITFKIRNDLIGSGALAAYNLSDCSIGFIHSMHITSSNLLEELIHVVQHQVYYGSDMINYRKEIEFEAKVLQDLWDVKNGYKPSMKPRFQTSALREQYKTWIQEEYNTLGFGVIENKFYDFCTQWTEYGTGVAQTTFPLQMLRECIN